MGQQQRQRRRRQRQQSAAATAASYLLQGLLKVGHLPQDTFRRADHLRLEIFLLQLIQHNISVRRKNKWRKKRAKMRGQHRSNEEVLSSQTHVASSLPTKERYHQLNANVLHTTPMPELFPKSSAPSTHPTRPAFTFPLRVPPQCQQTAEPPSLTSARLSAAWAVATLSLMSLLSFLTLASSSRAVPTLLVSSTVVCLAASCLALTASIA